MASSDTRTRNRAPWGHARIAPHRARLHHPHTNLRTFTGITLPTGSEGTPAAQPPHLPDLEALGRPQGPDATWEESKLPGSAQGAARSLHNWRFFVAREGPLVPAVLDMWIRLSSGERIMQDALAYYNLHEFLAAPELRELLQAARKGEAGGNTAQAREIKSRGEQRATMWFPTVVMNLEVKTALPEEGVEWLAVRVTSKQIKDGRFDLDVSGKRRG
ncbi:hypothetical protein diail_11692 [Diaporthe ilicicola]|nr:hypothetical protein diail_11692 [Diaporthe ilicicola]